MTGGRAVLCFALGLISIAGSAQGPPSKRMADGKQWMTRNLDAPIDPSYCYEDTDANCRRYGRLYSWEAARRGCQSLGDGWRLPANDEWAQLAKHYGGLMEEGGDAGKATYTALMIGGKTGFDAVFGGGRINGEYARADAHGFYWTATESGTGTAWLYNFGKGGSALNRHRNLAKDGAFAVRCIKD
jgi:uncharacterized protein (TIGR02145 family)